MKYTSFTLSRPANFALRFTLAVIGFLACGPFGLLAGILNPDGFGTPLLGSSYTRINATTKANLTGQAAAIQEELWARGVVGTSNGQYQTIPFADGMMGNGTLQGASMIANKGSTLSKAILNITDTTKVQGTIIHIPTFAGLGGPGVFGEGDRIGSEQKLRIGSFPVQIGRAWFGAGWTAIARDETVIGSFYDQMVATGLRMQVAKKKNDDIMMKIIEKAGVSGRNYVLPDGVASRAALVSTNVFSTSLITKVNSHLQGIGAQAMDFVNNDGGLVGSKYVILGPSDGMRPLKVESAYIQNVQQGDVRGDMNAQFRGNFKDVDGVGLYPWEQINHANYGSVGSPLLPRAFLGNVADLTGDSVGVLLTGGGSAAAAAVTPTPHYYEFFSNAPWTYTNGQTIAAVTNVNRYVKATNPDGTSAVLKYSTNDGTKIVLPTSSIQTVSGSTATTLQIGALIEECNVLGWTFCRHLALAQQAVLCGAGSISGTNGGTGRRTEETRNHGLEQAVGVEYSWGCEAYQRPDSIYPGFLVVETAMPSAA